MGFNDEIFIEDLPSAWVLDYKPLEKKYLSVLLWTTGVRVILTSLVVLTGMIIFYNNMPPFIIMLLPVALIVYVAWSFVSVIFGFRHKAYALRTKDISYKSGWLWRSVITVSFNRVQHVEIEAGFIERQFGLAKLKVYTAGGSSSDITIPGLKPSDARALKEYIVGRTTDDEEE